MYTPSDRTFLMLHVLHSFMNEESLLLLLLSKNTIEDENIHNSARYSNVHIIVVLFSVIGIISYLNV